MKLLFRILLPLIILVAAGYGTWLLIQNRPEPLIRVAETRVPVVETIEAVFGSVTLRVRAEGTVAPRAETELIPEVTGRVVEISPNLVAGGFFEQGEVLFRLDGREYELAVTRARAAIAQANLRLETEKQEAVIAQQEWQLLDIGRPTPLALREPQIAEAQAALASAQATLAQAQYDLERTVVRAPYDGRVRAERVDVGQFVSRGAPVATLYSVDTAEVRLPIPDAELAFVDIPMTYRDDNTVAAAAKPRVILRASFAGKTYQWEGEIDRTEGEIDAKTRMVNVIARVADPYARRGKSSRPPLAVGMFVQAEILGRSSGKVASLPRTALRGSNRVLIADDDDQLRFTKVGIFRLERDRILLSSGIEEGDRIVVSPLEGAVDGMTVRVKIKDTQTD